MLRAGEVAKAPAVFDENDRTYWPKTDLPPSREKLLGMWPAIKRQAEGILLQGAPQFSEDWHQPGRIGVPLDDALRCSPSAGIGDEVRWIGQNKVDGF